MKRSIKNVIMFIIIIAMIVSICFTIGFSKKNIPGKDMMVQTNINLQMQGNTANMNMQNNGEQPPEMPNNLQENMGKMPSDNQMPMEFSRNNNIESIYYIVFGIESLIIALIIMYLVMSKFNKKAFKETFVNSDKVIIYVLSVVIVTTCITVVICNLTSRVNVIINENSSEKETSAADIEEGEIVNSKVINLEEYNSNLTIKEAGEYTLSGNFEHSILIDSTGDVILNLDNVTVNSSVTATIANISKNDLTLNLISGTVNSLTDGGSSEYDACIYSEGDLIINGDGTLYVYGKQTEGEGIATDEKDIIIDGGNIFIECTDDGLNAGGDGGEIVINDGSVYIKASGDGIDSNQTLVINGGTVYSMGSAKGGDAGIDTDGGFSINGGTVIALGSDMLETPKDTSKQNTICFNLDSVINSGTLISLVNNEGEIIVSFKADENFRTLIISSDKLTNGIYYLYKDGNTTGKLQENSIYQGGSYTNGTKVSVSGSNEFNITSSITKVGIN